MGVWAKASRRGAGFYPTYSCTKIFNYKWQAIRWAKKVMKKSPEWKISVKGAGVFNEEQHNELFERRQSLWLRNLSNYDRQSTAHEMLVYEYKDLVKKRIA